MVGSNLYENYIVEEIKMTVEVQNKAFMNAVVWGLFGTRVCGIKGGLITAITGVGLVLRRPLIYAVAKEYKLEDHKVALLSSASSHLLHAICCVGLYAFNALDATDALIAGVALTSSALVLDPSSRFAWTHWGSPLSRVIQQNDQHLQTIYQ